MTITAEQFLIGLGILAIVFTIIIPLIAHGIVAIANYFAADDDGSDRDADLSCWGRWSEVVCPECGRHICGQAPTPGHDRPIRIFELCQHCQRIQSHPSHSSHNSHPIKSYGYTVPHH